MKNLNEESISKMSDFLLCRINSLKKVEDSAMCDFIKEYFLFEY